MNVRANKILLLTSSLATMALLSIAAYQENVLQEWRQLQRRYQSKLPPAESADFSVQLRQVVAPALGVTDRCISCHLGMAPGEREIPGDPLFGRHPALPHDPSEFGCTVCHGGQGRATKSDAAHGDVPFWPEPMIPRPFAYAGCGSCHTHLAVPDAGHLALGRAVFERNDCLACHKLEGRGGTLRPGGAGGMEGPDLSRIGKEGYDTAWYESHRAQAAVDSRFAMSIGELNEGEAHALRVFLDSRVGAPGLVESKAIFHSRGCRGCHKVGGVGGDDGPDLTRVGQKDPGRIDWSHVPEPHTLASWFAEHFRAPGVLVKGSGMPALGLSESDIRSLTFYLLSLRRSAVPEAFWPLDRIEAERFGKREFASDGPTLFGTFCAACHGPRGEGMRYAGLPAFPAIANEDFLRLASDEFLAETIRRGRPGRRMPAWGAREGALEPPDVAVLIAHLRELAGGVAAEVDARPPRWASGDARLGASLYAANCARCHGATGQGGEGVALNNTVLLESATDTYLFETILRGRRGTTMAGFAEGSSISATLAPSEIESIVTYLRSWSSPALGEAKP